MARNNRVCRFSPSAEACLTHGVATLHEGGHESCPVSGLVKPSAAVQADAALVDAIDTALGHPRVLGVEMDNSTPGQMFYRFGARRAKVNRGIVYCGLHETIEAHKAVGWLLGEPWKD